MGDSSTLDQCPKCRVPYGEEKVAHLPNCLYSGNKLKFCGEIGFTECNHVSDCSQSEQIVNHLRTHGVIVTDKTDVSVRLEDFKRWMDFHSKMENSKSVWGPFVLTKGALKILVLAVFQGKTKMFSWVSIYLGSPSEFVGIEHKVKLSIKSTTKNQSQHLQVPDMSWEINTMSMLHVGKWLCLQPFQIPSRLLLDGYTGSDGSLQFKASVMKLNHSTNSTEFDLVSSLWLGTCVKFSNPVRALTTQESETSVDSPSSSSSSSGLRGQRSSGERYTWIPASNGEIVSNPVPTRGWFSNIYYVVRAKVPGRDIIVPGYLFDKEAWISFNGQIHKMQNYEMLSIPGGRYEWSDWKVWGPRIPISAVAGGIGENEEKYYVGQSGDGLGEHGGKYYVRQSHGGLGENRKNYYVRQSRCCHSEKEENYYVSLGENEGKYYVGHSDSGLGENGKKYYVGQYGGGLVGRIEGGKCYEAGTWNERECEKFRYLLLK